MDIKKLGTFPIVHGLRALALHHHLAELGTVARIRTLAARGLLDADLARDLIDTLHFLMGLKLRHNGPGFPAVAGGSSIRIPPG